MSKKAEIIVTAMRRVAAPSKHGPCRVATTMLDVDRYFFDTLAWAPGAAWQQWDTSSDAWYFGVWVNPQTREILTYAEGDVSLSIFADAQAFAAEIDRMAEFHGAPPPAIVVLDLGAKTRTDYVDNRLTGAAVLASAGS